MLIVLLESELTRGFNGLWMETRDFTKGLITFWEIKWKTGAMGAFRLYCAEIDGVILLLGGHKDKQSKDIKTAKKLLDGVKNGETRIKEYE